MGKSSNSLLKKHGAGVIASVIAFAVIITGVLVFVIVAATRPQTVEPENSVDENTTVQQDDDSSGGEFVEFGGEGTDPAADTVTYQVTFDVTWNADDHGTDFPGGAHTSPAVMVAHSSSYAFFGQDTLASPGFKLVAETGSTSIIAEELDAEKASGVLDYALGSRLDAPDSQVINLTFSKDQPLFSMISMLAPSPDWVIGAQNIEIYNAETDEWADDLQFDLGTYDAGTDSGETFTAGNLATDPQAFITPPVDDQLIRTADIGFGRVTLTQVQ